jgi:MoCo/4Fe-4S cofactor protein with predicted Tat translocation signal
MKKQKKDSNKLYWRSINQQTDTPEFREFLQREFPEGASELQEHISRRKFITLMGASMALGGLTACRRPVEKIVPYAKAPEEIIPGIPKYYATTMTMGTHAYGLLVESHEGRPTKIEGNEKHPSTKGGTNSYLQAAILGLYDPDRSQRVVRNGVEKEWYDFVSFWQSIYPEYVKTGGEGFAVLSESFSSPTLYRLKSQFLNNFPKAKWYTYEPLSDFNICQGIEIATGSVSVPNYHFDQAQIILALDSDFLHTDSENITHAQGFIAGRRIESVTDKMNRLYVVEPSFTLTGGMADHRLSLPCSQLFEFLTTLILELNNQGLTIEGVEPSNLQTKTTEYKKWNTILANDLIANRGKSIVVAGRKQPPIIHALVFAINTALGNLNKTIFFHKPVDTAFDNPNDIAALTQDLKDGLIKSLTILGGNPVYNAPVDIEFEGALRAVEHTIHLSPYKDETSSLVEWHIPQAHFLENWGDARASNGTASVIQPLIAPLYDGHSPLQLINLFSTGTDSNGYDLVRETWKKIIEQRDFEQAWQKVLHDGILENSGANTVTPVLRRLDLKNYLSSNPLSFSKPGRDNLEIIFQTSSAVYDGRFANNGWLQELPDSVSKLAWDNAAFMSPTTAVSLGVKNEDMIELKYRGRNLPIVVWTLPGQAKNSISLHLGYGRSKAGRIGSGVGFNTFKLRTTHNPDFDLGLRVAKTNETYPLSNTQDHSSMEGRPIVREASLEEYRKNPEFAREMVEHPPLKSLWEEHSYEEGYQWGMSIDLNACTGCNACSIACQSENNIPIIGKAQVKKGREMHWLRLDRYFSGDVENPEMVHQPVACQHCENAPCEQVCPVAATVHDSEGLNVMTYNRCIGTRYCSNNCPYKVRRFNFFNYTKELPEVVQMVQNPDVTVRSRGVMEKCTYCLQRINEAKINAKNKDRFLEDGEIVTACQQACPTNAIVFGNINDPESQVVKEKSKERNYALLAELNIQPRTSYLAKLRNPNPDLENNR